MKEVTIVTRWRATNVVEVPDDFEVPEYLNDFPEDVLEQLDTRNAEITDWEQG